MADISVFIVSYNTRDVLEACLSSVRRHIEPGLVVEVFVIDNASVDGSAEMVAQQFPEVQLIRSPTNVGFASANNLALPAATGRYIFLLNSDTVLQEGCFRKLAHFMTAHPDAGIVGPRLLNADGTLQPSVRSFPTARALLFLYTILRLWRPWLRDHAAYKMKGFDYSKTSEVDVPMGAALFIDGAIYRQLGGLDGGYFMYFEEADLCRRVRALARKMYYCPEVTITHLGGESSRPEKAFLFRVYLESLFRYVAGDLGRGRYFWFRVVFKLGFLLKQLTDIPIQVFYLLRYAVLRPNSKKLAAKRAELGRSLRFFAGDLGWLLFRLGR